MTTGTPGFTVAVNCPESVNLLMLPGQVMDIFEQFTKQTVTSFKVGVTALFVVLRYAFHFK